MGRQMVAKYVQGNYMAPQSKPVPTSPVGQRSTKKVAFVNAQAMYRKHPTTFYVPGDLELKALKPGCIVKVCYNSERFWVILTAVNTRNLEGRNLNMLTVPGNEHLRVGTKISFHTDNVYDIYAGKTRVAREAPPAAKKAAATKRLPTTKKRFASSLRT